MTRAARGADIRPDPHPTEAIVSTSEEPDLDDEDEVELDDLDELADEDWNEFTYGVSDDEDL